MLHKIRFNKKNWFCIIILELILLGMIFFVLRQRPSVELTYTQDDLIYDSGEAGFYLDTSNSKDYTYTATRDFTLPKGFYTLEAQVEYRGAAVMEVVSDEKMNPNVSDTISLPFTSAGFRVKDSERAMRVQGRLTEDAMEGDYILIRDIRITTSPLTVRNIIFYTCVIFLIIDVLLLLVCYQDRIKISDETQLYIKIIVLLVAAVSVPLMTNYLFAKAHDLVFHLTRIEGIKEEILNGNFPVRMQTFWLRGHGYPVSIFYGDILLYIPALLRICGVSVQASYNFYVLLINIGTVLIAFYCFSKMSNAKAGMVCTIVYSLNIYRLFDIYTRAAVGEYTAIMFMPLILYGMWCIYALPEERTEHSKGWLPLSIGCSGIFLSHMLTTEITAFFIIIAAVILWKKTFRKATMIILLKAAAATLLLTLWFLVPFLDYMRSDNYGVGFSLWYEAFQLESRGVFPAQLFMNRYSVMQVTTAAVEGAVSDMPLTVGLASVLVLAGWFVFCLGKKRDKTEKKEEYLAVILSLLSIGMTMYFFPYTWLSDKIPVIKALIKNIQYSWRFFAAGSILLAWLLCIILRKEWIGKKEKQIFVDILIFIAFWQGISYMSDVLNVAAPTYIFQEGGLTTMDVYGGEYLLGVDEDYDYADQLIYVEDVISVSDWHREKGQTEVSLVNNTDQMQQVELPVFNYKGYHAFTGDGEELQISFGDQHRISVLIPGGYSGTIQVGFSEPWYWRVCELISLATLLCLIIYPIRQKHIQKKQGSDGSGKLMVDS